MSTPYQLLWQSLIAAQTTPERWVEVKVADTARIQNICNVIQNIKSKANVTRRRLDLPAFGKLEIKRLPAEKKVLFRLKDSGDAL